MTTITLGSRVIGDGHPCLVIAEIGSNHDGDLYTAKALVDAAAKAGADAVKFQSFSARGLYNLLSPNGDSTWAENPAISTLERLELPPDWHAELAAHADSRGLLFLSTPFDEERLELLDRLKVPAIKIASGDLTHVRLLEAVGRTGRPVLLSTGLGTLAEVEQAVGTIGTAAGWSGDGDWPIVLLHCVSSYPSRPSDANIRAMVTLRAAFGLHVGYSDHSPGHVVALGAVALGARVIEKHLTLGRERSGPDHSFALEPIEFGRMVADIRELEGALGDGTKRPVTAETEERTWARRGLYARETIRRGTRITRHHVKIVRPCVGLEPAALDAIEGREAAVDIPADHPLAWELVR
jgi:N,N'-diacetyllegionaminate synthase